MRIKGNDPRADHVVHGIFDTGYCVKFRYKGYEVSLASDGQETAVFSGNKTLFKRPGTGVDSIAKAKEFIDSL